MDTSFNILASYAYLATNKKFLDIVMNPARAGEINLMIDSGAFTAHNSKGNKEHINVDSYCDFLDIFGNYCEKYVMLDVILNESASKRNYETMVKRGLKPMFVVTAKESDFSYVKDTLSVNENICVAGGVTEPVSWCVARFQNVYYKTGEKAKIHGLGFVKFPTLFQVPIRSVDSSSWEVASLKYGNAIYWKNGLKHLSWQNVLKHGGKIPDYAKETMDRLCISPAMYQQEKYHRGGNSLDMFLSTFAYVQYQKYAKRCGKQLFLAACNEMQMKRLLYINENYKDLKFENYLKHVTA